MSKKKHVAIVLGAGKGKRMQTDVPKQFLEIEGKPVLAYSLLAFQESFVDEIILVTGADQIDYCRQEIVEAFGITKVKAVIAGGAERYDSVYAGLQAIEDADYVYIHDGARPFVDQAILQRAKETVEECRACVAGMPVKDTIKIVDADRMVEQTPVRSFVWQVQTPQVFHFDLVKDAYEKMQMQEDKRNITDDAMVVEQFADHRVKLFEGSYENLKITTPDDLLQAGWILQKRNRK